MCEGASGWNGRPKKRGLQSIGRTKGGNNTKLHVVSADDQAVVGWALSAGNAHDAPEGRKLLKSMDKVERVPLLMDKAYKDNETRAVAVEQGYIPVVPPKRNRIVQWEHDKELYKKRNVIERLFRRIKGFRRIFTRYDKLDLMFMAYLMFALIYIYSK